MTTAQTAKLRGILMDAREFWLDGYSAPVGLMLNYALSMLDWFDEQDVRRVFCRMCQRPLGEADAPDLCAKCFAVTFGPDDENDHEAVWQDAESTVRADDGLSVVFQEGAGRDVF